MRFKHGSILIALTALVVMLVSSFKTRAFTWDRTLRSDSLITDTATRARILLTFIVEKDGTLSNVDGKLDWCINCPRKFKKESIAQAISVLKKSKKWEPGIQEGKPIRVKYTLPIVFSPQADSLDIQDSFNHK